MAEAAEGGRTGQGAVVWATCRLRDSMSKAQEATNRFTGWIMWFTFVMVVLVAMQLVVVALQLALAL